MVESGKTVTRKSKVSDWAAVVPITEPELHTEKDQEGESELLEEVILLFLCFVNVLIFVGVKEMHQLTGIDVGPGGLGGNVLQ